MSLTPGDLAHGPWAGPPEPASAPAALPVKDRWHLAPLDSFRAIVSMLGHGVPKHDGDGGDDWRRGRDWSTDWDALQRHLTSWWLREGPDPGSGRSHLWHAGARIVILIAAELRGIGRDDRPAPRGDGAP